MKCPRRGLYAITQVDGKSDAQVLDDVEAALKTGVVMLQYRDKNPVKSVALALGLKRLCAEHQIPFIVNDDVNLAAQIDADGVHLGQHDVSLAHAKATLGDGAIIGVSCYNSLQYALDAEQAGASYVAFGRFFPSDTKPLATPAHIETLRLAKQQLAVPIVAIGGILPENGGLLVDAGADLLAVVGGVFNSEPQASVSAYLPLFL